MGAPQDVAVRLDAPVLHVGTIRSTAPLTVESAPEQWAYAISVPLESERTREWLRPGFKVRAKVTIHSGALQCLLTAKDFVTMLGVMATPVPTGAHVVEILFEREGAAPQFIFRNAGADRQPCVFSVEMLSIAPDAGDSLKWSLGLGDVMAGTPPRISVEDLHRAVVNRERLLADDGEVFDRLRRKWSTVPAGLSDRRSSSDLLNLSDRELSDFWIETHRHTTTGEGFGVRGWYQTLYRDALRGRKVLEIGSGMGIDGIDLARHGATMTFVDIVEHNLELMKRLCAIFGIANARFVYLQNLSSLGVLPDDYDVVWCQGSQINVPFDFAKRECAVILRHLKPGGRWIELAYPRERWVRDGSPPFRMWGTMTDGEGTPWMEWYDLDKLLDRLAPVRFDPVLAFNFHDDDFNWFDLRRTDA
jgi:SAM-dependent methyltransferase